MKLIAFFSSILLLVASIVATNTQQKPYSPIRITFFLKKSSNLTDEDFHHHYSTYHGPLCVPWLKKYGIIEYNQYHATSNQRDAIQPLTGPTATLGDYDAYTEFLVESVEVFQKAFEDPFYAERIRPDEIYLFGDSPFVLTAGYRQVFWKSDLAYVGAS